MLDKNKDKPKNEDNSKNEDDIKENLLRTHLTANSTLHHFYRRGEFCIIKQVSDKNVGGHFLDGPPTFLQLFCCYGLQREDKTEKGKTDKHCAVSP